MKINLSDYNNSYHSHSRSLCPPKESEHNRGVYECENKRGNIIAFNGSRASKVTSDTAVKVYENLGHGVFDKIGNSKKFQKLLNIFEEKTIVAQALVALVVAGIMRPITNLAMAGKDDKDDAKYAASHAIASAVIGFLVSYTVMLPFDKAFKNIKENPQKYLQGLEKVLGVPEIGKRKLAKSQAYKNISKVAQMIPDSIVMGIPKAMLTIALIPPILKYVFGMEKHKKTQTENTNAAYMQNFIDKPAFKSFMGGSNASNIQ